MFTTTDGSGNYQCNVAVSYMDDISILGDTFMRNYLTTFDYKNEQVQLSINVNAPSNVKIGSKPNTQDGDSSDSANVGAIVGIIIAVLITLIVLAYLSYCCIQKEKKRRLTLAYRTKGSFVDDNKSDISEDPPLLTP